MKTQKGCRGKAKGFCWWLALWMLLQPLQPATAATLSSVGGWTQEINSSNLISRAGSNSTGTYLSAPAATTLEVSGCISDSDKWQISIKKVDNFWDSDRLVLFAKITDEGVGPGTINGGDSFQVVNNVDSLFITGQGNRAGITVQYRLTGMSTHTPLNTYSASVEFSIVP